MDPFRHHWITKSVRNQRGRCTARRAGSSTRGAESRLEACSKMGAANGEGKA
jgi:hypothetical protein